MVARHLLTACITLLFSAYSSYGQVSLTGSPYTQNFDALASTGTNVAIVNNSAPLTGWFSTRPTYNADAGTNNNGSQYSYGNVGSTDRSWGSRASGGTATMYFGLVMQNNMGVSIGDFTVSYTGEHWRLAEKGTTSIDGLFFYYQVAPSISDLTSGTWIAVPALNFLQIQNNAVCGSSGVAIDGNQPANRAIVSGSITVNVPAGQMIAFRWEDVNDPCNDHGLSIDDLTIIYQPLPVVLSAFQGSAEGEVATLAWETASESQNRGFAVEKSLTGTDFSEIGFVEGNGTTQQMRHYQFKDPHFTQTAWYRLRQMDFNGAVQYSDIIELRTTNPGLALPVSLFPNPFKDGVFMQCDLCGIFDEQQVKVKVVTNQGKTIMDEVGTFNQVSNQLTEKTSKLPAGIYWVEISANDRVDFHRILKQ